MRQPCPAGRAEHTLRGKTADYGTAAGNSDFLMTAAQRRIQNLFKGDSRFQAGFFIIQFFLDIIACGENK